MLVVIAVCLELSCWKVNPNPTIKSSTAPAKVFNDIYLNMDWGRYTVLVLLDPRVAFDIVEHEILYKMTQELG